MLARTVVASSSAVEGAPGGSTSAFVEGLQSCPNCPCVSVRAHDSAAPYMSRGPVSWSLEPSPASLVLENRAQQGADFLFRVSHRVRYSLL